MAEKIDGVGVLYYPNGINQDMRRLVRDMVSNIRVGSILCLPTVYDENGARLWDFKIEGGDPGQVEVRQVECDNPFVVEKQS